MPPASPQSDDGNPRWPGKTTSNPENHTGVLFKELEKKESTQEGHSSSNLRWLAEWERGRWCEESEGSRALMFKSFLYDKHAALLEPVKRKAEMWGGEGAVQCCFGGPPETKGCNEWLPPWKLTFLKGLVTPIPCWCVAQGSKQWPQLRAGSFPSVSEEYD